MEILKRNCFIVECPCCKSLLRVCQDDMYRSFSGNVCFQCPVCKKNTIIYNYNTGINKRLKIDIAEDNKDK